MTKKKWFTKLSIERHAEVRFDEEKGFITKDDKMMDKISNAKCKDYHRTIVGRATNSNIR